MCTKTNLVTAFVLGNSCLAVCALALFILGIMLTTDHRLHQAFGTKIQSVGHGLLWMLPVYGAFIVTGNYGARNHNKFVLLVYIIGFLCTVIAQIAYGGIVVNLSNISYTTEEIRDCVTVRNANNTECIGLRESDEYASLYLAWRGYFYDSQFSDSQLKDMKDLQSSYGCCGLGPPTHCLRDFRPMPSNLPLDGDFMGTAVRQNCSLTKHGYYPATEVCNIPHFSTGAPVLLGCNYDYPAGECFKNAVSDSAKGCAAALYEFLAEKARSRGQTILLLGLCPMLCIFISVCLFLKRKDDDALPMHLVYGHPKTYEPAFVVEDDSDGDDNSDEE